ncbi:hypothetical protein ESCAB7627_2548 [Escherichia albertii TW07627]|uniref:Uncharacterized protein n=1 Tax=Escherichia albertii (strain TW07627) TaxID=502347 RepID=A0ABC9NNQ5_ESCAT|nr:hypothetical protein ESCAB7627_2548 [Escherichia albertii TW07627]
MLNKFVKCIGEQDVLLVIFGQSSGDNLLLMRIINNKGR